MALTGLIYNTSKGNDREQWRRSLAEAGLTLVDGSFEEGATASSKTAAVWYIAGGQCYTWDGGLPKEAPAGSTPGSTGGVGSGSWVSVGGNSLRKSLATPGSSTLVDPTMVKVSPQGNLSQVLRYVTPEQFVWPGETFRDGINNDAVQINRALTYIGEQGGGTVWLGAGDYYQLTSVVVHANTTLKGAGMYNTRLHALNAMPRKLNSITTANNLLIDTVATSDITGWEYIDGVVIEDLGVYANHPGRDPYRKGSSGLGTEIQACGVKLTSARDAIVRRVYVERALLHCFNVAAQTYFNDGDYTHSISGGSDRVVFEDCVGKNSLYDDIFTCHNSYNIKYSRCHASNDNTDPNMTWQNNQHGFEFDEGCQFITADNCVADYLMTGFQVKGHSTTMPCRDVVINSCHAKNCAWSYQIEHIERANAKSGVLATGVVLTNCISENAYNHRYATDDPVYRAKAAWLRSFNGIIIKNFTVIGGSGTIELDGGVESVVIDGVLFKGGYNGAYQNTNSAGLINVVSSQTRGHHVFKNIVVADAVNIPVVRCVDNTLVQGFTVQSVIARGDGEHPAIYCTLNVPATIKDLNLTGFTYAIYDTAGAESWGQYPTDVNVNIDSGQVMMRISGAPDPAVHPRRMSAMAMDVVTGTLWASRGNGANSAGIWAKVGLQS